MKRETVPELTILMPCLNEAKTLPVCIRKARLFCRQNNVRAEILIADNGSTDGSPEIARKAGGRIISVEEKGYGAALMSGIRAAKGTYIIMGDSDDSYDYSALMPFLEKLREGYDLVMGNRFKGGIKPGAMPALHKYLGNPVLSWLGRLFFNSPVRDFHCGLRGFRRDMILRLDLCTTGMEFASEMVVKATLLGLKIIEVPTILYPDGRDRPPHLNSWRDGWRHLRFLLLYSPRWLFLYPGLFAIGVGLAGSLWLLPGARRIGSITLDINSFLFSNMLILIGFQMVNFAIITRAFAINEQLLPASDRLSHLLKFITLERGILMGTIVGILGLAGSLLAVSYWSSRSFGPLDPLLSLRMVIPGAVMLVLGLQTILSSFLLSILNLKRR